MKDWSRRAVLGAGLGATVSFGCRSLGGGSTTATGGGWIWSGGVTASTATVVAKGLDPSTAVLRLVGSIGKDTHELTVPPREAPGPIRFDIRELEPNVRYHYVAVDGAGRTLEGSLKTFPREGPASFTVCAASCAQTGSEHPVFDTIRHNDPLAFIHLGDMHYENIADGDEDRFRAAYDRVMSSSRQAALYRHVPTAYVWDDHDFGPNNSHRESASKGAARNVYRTHVPSYALVENGAIHHAFTIGRVRFIMTDCRSERTAPGTPHRYRTMLGRKQKAWLKAELLESKGRYPLVVWVSTVGWIGNEADGDAWPGFPSERAELAMFLVEHGIHNVLMLCGDAHMLAIDDGRHNVYGYGGPRFPVFHVAALDQRGSDKGGPYSHGVEAGGGHFGVVQIDDRVHEIGVTLSGRDAENRPLMEHRFTVVG